MFQASGSAFAFGQALKRSAVGLTPVACIRRDKGTCGANAPAGRLSFPSTVSTPPTDLTMDSSTRPSGSTRTLPR